MERLNDKQMLRSSGSFCMATLKTPNFTKCEYVEWLSQKKFNEVSALTAIVMFNSIPCLQMETYFIAYLCMSWQYIIGTRFFTFTQVPIKKHGSIFFVIKPTRCTNFTNLFCHETTCFGQFVCPSSGVDSLYTQQWCMSHRYVDSFRAGPGWICSSILVLLRCTVTRT